MPTWDPYTIILGNWAWADGAQSVLGPTWATQCTPMAYCMQHRDSGRMLAMLHGMPGHSAVQQRVVLLHGIANYMVVVYDSLCQMTACKISCIKLR